MFIKRTKFGTKFGTKFETKFETKFAFLDKKELTYF